MEKDIKVFGELYLDADTDPKLNKGSDYILNTIIQSDGRFGVAINVKGNELVTDQSLLNSVFPNTYSAPIKVIGFCIDEARNRVIYFVCNASSAPPPPFTYNSAIFYYDISTGENKLILNASHLNFNYDLNISANIIGDLLLWTDGSNPPRKINYIKAYNLTNSISTDYKYQTLSNSIINAYKKPPDYISAGMGGSIYATKVLKGKSYQFACRYVYDDYEKSVLSPFSELVFTDERSFPDGSGTNYSSAYKVGVSFNFPLKENGVFTDIDSIELFVRNSDIGNWYLYDKIDAPKINSFVLTYYSAGSYDDGSGIITTDTRGSVSQDVYDRLSVGLLISYSGDYYRIVEKFTSSGYFIIGISEIAGTGWSYTFNIEDSFYYQFYDDKIKQTVDQDDLARPYDFLPKLAGTQELIEKDKLIYADITEGFDNVSINADISVSTYNTSVDSIDVVGHVDILSTYANIRWNSYSSNILYVLAIEYFTSGTNTKTISVSYKSVSGDTETTILTYIRNMLIAAGVTNSSIATNSSPSYKYIKILTGSPGITFNTYAHQCFGYSLKYTFKSLKNNDSYLASIRYFDENLRYSTSQRVKSIINTPSVYSNFNDVYSVVCDIKNKPPVWAYYYSIDFTKRIKTDYYLRLAANGHLGECMYYSDTDGFLRIKINKIINNAIDFNKNLNIKSYEFQPGDRIVLLGYYNLNQIVEIFPSGQYDFEIKGIEWPVTDARYKKDYATNPSYIIDQDGNKINNPDSQVIIVPITTSGGIGNNIYREILFEIYRPKKEASNVYYYPCYFGAIGSPGTLNNYHTGNTQNQNPYYPVDNPAIVSCNPGDTYMKLRFANFTFPSLSDNYSDYYESNSFGNGRPNIYDPDTKEERLISAMRHSGPLLEGSKVNKLNQFKSEDIEILKSKFGAIRSLKEVGNVLKVLQDKKERSIYISRTEMQNADNTSNVVKSTALLGTVNDFDEDRGTIFPKSVVLHNRNLYYFDVYKGEVIRTSPNGQFPISEYGMRAYFKDKANSIIEHGVDLCEVIAGFDEENKIYLITFKIGVDQETLGFYDPEIGEAKPRWISFYSFCPELYANFGITLISFNNGLGYKHNSSNVNRCTFYGSKYKQQVNWYSNAVPILKKIFMSVAVKSNKPWNVPVILIEADSSYIRGMKSKLTPAQFKLKEGSYYAAYLNNMLTSSSSESVLDLMNGDKLRGFYIKHQMENAEDVEVWVIDSEVNYIQSSKY